MGALRWRPFKNFSQFVHCFFRFLTHPHFLVDQEWPHMRNRLGLAKLPDSYQCVASDLVVFKQSNE